MKIVKIIMTIVQMGVFYCQIIAPIFILIFVLYNTQVNLIDYYGSDIPYELRFIGPIMMIGLLGHLYDTLKCRIGLKTRPFWENEDET